MTRRDPVYNVRIHHAPLSNRIVLARFGARDNIALNKRDATRLRLPDARGESMTRALILLLALSACTPSTATHHALHEGRDVSHAAEHVSMVDAPGTSSGGGVN